MKWVKFDCNGDEQVWYSADEVDKLKAENKQLQTDYDALDACVELLRAKIRVLEEELQEKNNDR